MIDNDMDKIPVLDPNAERAAAAVMICFFGLAAICAIAALVA